MFPIVELLNRRINDNQKLMILCNAIGKPLINKCSLNIMDSAHQVLSCFRHCSLLSDFSLLLTLSFTFISLSLPSLFQKKFQYYDFSNKMIVRIYQILIILRDPLWGGDQNLKKNDIFLRNE